MTRLVRLLASLAATVAVSAQGISGLDLNALRQQARGQEASGSLPSAPNRTPAVQDPRAAAPQDGLQADAQAREARIRALKSRDAGPVRFGSDLFDTRQSSSYATDGAVSEDYVLGPGDQLYLNATGSANFDFASQVDGTGSLAIPKVGSARVSGLSLAKAKAVVQRLVEGKFSQTRVDLQVIQLREIRISILGEVYLPGSYLVPSLASLVNVLSLAGGPTAIGSYRDIRVLRGGQVVSRLDLYPLRAEGLGNPDFALQSGDVVFVPLAQDQVVLEGAFRRVVHQPLDAEGTTRVKGESAADLEREQLQWQIQTLERRLGKGAAQEQAASGEGQLSSQERKALQDQVLVLNAKLGQLSSQSVGDHRVQMDPLTGAPEAPEKSGLPVWVMAWRTTGKAPQMAFEIRAGESLADVVRFAGGLMAEVASAVLTIRRKEPGGAVNAYTVPAAPGPMGAARLAPGDVVSALPLRETLDRIVSVEGWARVPGEFSRTDGLRVGDLLKRDGQILPDTYMARGEIIRTADDGRTSYLAFDVGKALSGDGASNMTLQNRDRVELYRIGDRRLPELLSVDGPVAYPGSFLFHEGMRASDLIFRAGVLQKDANTLSAQLSRVQDGKASSVVQLDLSHLASSDTASPVGLEDDAVNPRLHPGDHLSFFRIPGYRPHRIVHVDGQVARPGVYTLEREDETLGELIARAGGLLPDAMPNAGILLRNVGTLDNVQALASGQLDPMPGNINAILGRLNETKRNPVSGTLQSSPLLHGLAEGNLNRLVVDFPAAIKRDSKADVRLEDGDQIIVPRATQEAYVVGETASPFAVFKVGKGETVRELLRRAGGPTRNADTWNIRLLKADGRIIDSWVMRKDVEPGDAVLVPQRIRRDTTWQENLQALTPIAILLNTLK